ncbi:hypothetical protein [Oleiharenicola lentus]|uniref:hypothetical protein n=1 Tax=Oleiharenicola lentus TaxID=2508720 RepID=UPI003F66D5AD
MHLALRSYFLVGFIPLAAFSADTNAIVRGKVFDLTDDKPLKHVTVNAKWASGRHEQPLPISAADGSYEIKVPANTQVVITYGGGRFLEEVWETRTGEPNAEHPHDARLMQNQLTGNEGLRYYEMIGQRLAAYSSSDRNRWLENIQASAIPTAAKVSIASTMANSPGSSPTLPEEWQALAQDNALLVKSLTDYLDAEVKKNKVLPGKQAIDAKFKTSSVALAGVLKDVTIAAPRDRERILESAEKNWGKNLRVDTEALLNRQSSRELK